MEKTKKQKLVKRIKNFVIDKTASAIATNFMGGRKARKSMEQSQRDVAVLLADRERGGNMPYPDNESNPQFRTMVQANEVRDRLKRNY